MPKTKRIGTLSKFLVLALLLLLEIVLFYWLGVGATDFDEASWAIYFTQIFVGYAALIRICIYLWIWAWVRVGRTKFRIKSYLIFLLPVVAQFSSQMISIAPTSQNWPVRANYFIAYFAAEIILAVVFVSFVEKSPPPETKQGSNAE